MSNPQTGAAVRAISTRNERDILMAGSDSAGNTRIIPMIGIMDHGPLLRQGFWGGPGVKWPTKVKRKALNPLFSRAVRAVAVRTDKVARVLTPQLQADLADAVLTARSQILTICLEQEWEMT
jgi:hypothetical protein